MALRVISRRRNNSVAFGAKRTFRALARETGEVRGDLAGDEE
jgi:hypothetical protein